jgi:polyisoprenyl-phosphate glycosyltransferase
MQAPQVSIVSPVYNTAIFLHQFIEEVTSTLNLLGLTFEIILVDDRSPDSAWEMIQDICKLNSIVKGIRLSKNFGQQAAIMAGLSFAKGEWIVVMDNDLQDQPKEITKLYNKAIEGYDIVLANRAVRNDHFITKLFSGVFYKLFSYLANTTIKKGVANFGIYNKKVIAEVNEINDYIKAFPLFVNWVGFKQTIINVEHAKRPAGKSAYSISKLFSLAFDMILSFSTKPLKLFIKFGILVSLISFIAGVYTLIKYATGQITVLGYSSIILSIWFFSGLIITTIGIVGIYIGKIFNQAKGRKAFIVDEITNTSS